MAVAADTWMRRADAARHAKGLEFHHRHPYGHGGGHSIENLRLMCHAHNAYLAEVDYGAQAARRWRARPAADPARADGH